MHSKLLRRQWTDHQQNPSPKGNMYHTTKYHNNAVITYHTPPHPTVVIFRSLHTLSSVHEVPLPHICRTIMWLWICCQFWRQTCVPEKRNTNTCRQQRPYISIIKFDTTTHPPQLGDPISLSLDPITVPSEAVAYYVHHITTKSDLVQ